jgi:hypothetical protein
MSEAMHADQGEEAALAVVPAAHAVRNMLDMPDALLTVLLEYMFRSNLTHSDRCPFAITSSVCSLSSAQSCNTDKHACAHSKLIEA